MLEKLYTWNSYTFLLDLEKRYATNNYCIVNFLYFANAMQYHLFEEEKTSPDKIYENTLLQSDFLLPDGIALQTRYRFFWPKKYKLSNLNGTDLTPQILAYFSKKYTLHLYIYSLYDEKIGKSEEWLHKSVTKLEQEYNIGIIHSYQSHYSQRWISYPWEIIWWKVIHDNGIINIFLNCTWTPFQENRTQEHKSWFVENNMMVLNVGWFLDFYSGFEKRAPHRIVKARILETFWRITTNPKKNLKKFIAMFGVCRVVSKKFIHYLSRKNIIWK